MSNHELFVFFLLLSRLPLYTYIVIRAWKFRHSFIIVSSFWLGAMGSLAMITALTNAFGSRLVSNILGFMFGISIFMLTYTAKELKRIEGKK